MVSLVILFIQISGRNNKRLSQQLYRHVIVITNQCICALGVTARLACSDFFIGRGIYHLFIPLLSWFYLNTIYSYNSSPLCHI